MQRAIGCFLLGALALILLLPSLNRANPRVAFLGDSLTWGWAFPRANLGIRGETTAQMLERFPQQVAAAPYRQVVILGGTNDTLLHVDPALTLANLRRMVDLAQAAGIRPLLGEIPPIYKEGGRYLGAAEALNAGIVRIASESRVPVVDYNAALRGHPEAYSDGVHLKRGAYLRMEWALVKVDNPF